MKISEAIKKAVETDDSKLAGKLVEYLRLVLGMNYNNCLSAFQKHGGEKVTPQYFESLMYSADTEGNGDDINHEACDE